jgi:hypothetical protein
MPKFDTFEAWVSVNGAKLDEYDVQEKVEANGIRVISCWIPSQTEQVLISCASYTSHALLLYTY